ncbi:MAG TPA: hypothetical protein VF730_15675 [Terracidiphilus sp.]
MRIVRVLAAAAAMAGLASLPLVAQQVNASAQQSASASAAGTHVNQSAGASAQAGVSGSNAEANGGATGSAASERHDRGGYAGANGSAAATGQMRAVTGELQGKLDSKTARVGEPVVLKTTDKIKTSDGLVIPRGSRLIGHVTEVQAHEKGHQESSLGIAFDRAELKNGQSFAIHSVIESAGPSTAALEAASMENENAFAGPAGGGAMAGGAAGGRVGGGLIGGGAGAVGGATSMVGGAGSGIASTAGGALNAGDNAVDATGSVAGNATGNLGRGLNGSAGAAGSLGTHATAIPGVMLSSSAAGDASGMFTAARQNVHFDSGTQMVVGIAAAR